MAKNSNRAFRIAGRSVFEKDGTPKPTLVRGIEKAIDVQRPLVLANIRRLQRRHPEASAAELVGILEKHYLAAVTGTGAAVGATAVVPAVGTVAALGLSAAATVGFLEATALFAQSVAELHGIHLTDPERGRTMVMAIMLGEEGTSLMQQLATGRGGTPWAGTIGGMPSGVMGGLGATIRKRFMRRVMARQGTALLGRALPLGIGAVVGGAGNHSMGRAVIASTRRAFGPPPETFDGQLVNDLRALPEERSA